jgi:hypothetical protein
VVDTLENALEKALSSPVATYYQRPMGQNFLNDQVLQNFIIMSMVEESRVDAMATAQAKSQKVQPFDIFSNKMEGKSAGKGKASTYLNIAYNMLRPPTHLAKALPERKKVASAFDSQSATIHVALNTALTVGCGFEVETLAPGGDTDEPVKDDISGPLMAVEVRHSVDLTKKKMQGTTTVKGVKGNMDAYGGGGE